MSSAVIGPELTDGVVLVRPPVEGDASSILAACQDLEISRFTALPAPYEWHHAAEWIAGAPEAWRSGASTPMVVVDATTGDLLGACGLLEMNGDRAEIGYWVKRQMRGRGVATRAVLLVTTWGLADLGLSLIELLADVRNVPSRRVAEKAGYSREGEVPPPARCAGRCTRMIRFVRPDLDA
ncbi:MAG: GNAT family N-acetyltransferase [Actinomycetota bacterium]|nr:GNAT family N-acetyltransferase [Actinomycetota bacterium]